MGPSIFVHYSQDFVITVNEHIYVVKCAFGTEIGDVITMNLLKPLKV